MRKRIAAGNWKMHKTNAETHAYVTRFVELAPSVPDTVELVLCPPFTALMTAGALLNKFQGENGRIKLGAQNMHWLPSGAYTGSISAPMLVELGVQYVILGHSECRMYTGDTDENVRLKTATALEYGLTPIVAVGESLDIRRAGRAREHVVSQTLGALAGLDAEALSKVVLAYEPIWAIGTGENCDPVEANAIMQAMRQSLDGLQDSPILYGGSVKPENIAQYMEQPDIDGGLVGGASLDPDAFAALATKV